MVGAGSVVHSLMWTFFRLRKACKRANININSDSYGDMFVTLKVHISDQDDQASRRGGRPARNQESGPGIRATSSSAPKSPETPAPPAPAPERRGRRRGPAATFRDERRRLGRIQSDVLLPAPAPPPPDPVLLLAPKERVGGPDSGAALLICCYE